MHNSQFWLHRLLFTEFAALALTKFSSEALFDKIVEAVAERFEANTVENLTCKGKLEKHTGLIEGNATLTHVEQSFVVELTYGAPV